MATEPGSRTVETRVDTPIEIALNPSDSARPELAYTILRPPPVGEASIKGSVLSYSPPAGWDGLVSVTFAPTDGTPRPETIEIDVVPPLPSSPQDWYGCEVVALSPETKWTWSEERGEWAAISVKGRGRYRCRLRIGSPQTFRVTTKPANLAPGQAGSKTVSAPERGDWSDVIYGGELNCSAGGYGRQWRSEVKLVKRLHRDQTADGDWADACPSPGGATR
jgi:hypothetical protein